jgi:hypothetical protein
MLRLVVFFAFVFVFPLACFGQTPIDPLPGPPPFPYDHDPDCTGRNAVGEIVICSDFFDETTATVCPAGPCDGAFPRGPFHCQNRATEAHSPVVDGSILMYAYGNDVKLVSIGHIVCATIRPCACELDFKAGVAHCITGLPREATLRGTMPTDKPCKPLVVPLVDTVTGID